MSQTNNPYHWSKKRSGEVDRSKRVAPGCEIKSSNILTGTRARVTHDYSLLNSKVVQYDYENLLDRPWVESHVKEEQVESNNVLEKRAKLSNITNKLSEMTIEKKSNMKKDNKNDKKEEKKKEEKKEEKEEEKKKREKEDMKIEKKVVKKAEKVEGVPQEQQEQAVRKRSLSKRKSRNFNKELLSSSITEQIKRLGGELGAVEELEYQHSLGHTVNVLPYLQFFLATKWGHEDKVLSNSELEIFGINFGHFALPKDEVTVDILRQKDVVLIGDGEVLLAVAQDSALTEDKDIIVHVVDDQDEVETVKLSELLADMCWEEANDAPSASVEL